MKLLAVFLQIGVTLSLLRALGWISFHWIWEDEYWHDL